MIFPSSPEKPPFYGDQVFDLLDSGSESIQAGFPYANSEGLRSLCTDSNGDDWRELVDSRWVIGLNQGITTPAVLQELYDISTCSVRLFLPRGEINSTNLNRPPFLHSKFLSVSSPPDDGGSILVTSANMTGAAMGESPTNFELGTMRNLSNRDWKEYQKWWNGLWEESVPLSEDLIDRYEEVRTQVTRSSPEIETGDSPDRVTYAQDAKYFWINAGGLSGWTRYQMDLQRDLAVFFGEPSVGERYVSIEFRGETYQQKLAPRGEYHWNERWRLHLPTDFAGQDEDFYPYKMILFEELHRSNQEPLFRMTVCGQSDDSVDRWRRNAEQFGVHDQTAPGEQGREYGYW